jgi:hypothetical protein
VEAAAGVRLEDLLAVVSRWPGLREVATEQQRLHEIYVAVVAQASGGDGERAPEEDGEEARP